MIFDKNRQKILLAWLKSQIKANQFNLYLSMLTGSAIAVLVVGQAWLLAILLQYIIVNNFTLGQTIPYLTTFFITVIVRTVLHYIREQVNFSIGVSIRKNIRRQIFDKLEQLGPAFINSKNIGSWTTLLIEQIEDLHDFYCRYLPQMRLAVLIPIFIFLAVLPVNWMAALILLITAPFIPLFMVLVGMGAADINRRNFLALSRLSGHYLDRLKSLETIRLFNQGARQATDIKETTEQFRKKTMDVLRLAFLSSGVLEFFSSVSIAIVAVYFGFSFLGVFNFGSYGLPLSLGAAFFVLILAPEFFQPLRDLGTFYHAKAQAIAAADAIYSFLSSNRTIQSNQNRPKQRLLSPFNRIDANNLIIVSHTGTRLIGPINFSVKAGEKIALTGRSGEGKTSLVSALLGFLPYHGSLKVNGIELNQLDMQSWRQQLSWIGQIPYLPADTVRQNILLAQPNCDEIQLQNVLRQSYVDEFIMNLPYGLETSIGDDAIRLSVGQAQRIAVARALIKPSKLLILDEPTASLDKNSAQIINKALKTAIDDRTVIIITHHCDLFDSVNKIWTIERQQLTITESGL